MTKTLDALVDSAIKPVDGRSLAVFRILFGSIMAIAMARYIANGWVDIHYVEPQFFFKYTGFEWVTVPGKTTLYLMAYGPACALLISRIHARRSSSLFRLCYWDDGCHQLPQPLRFGLTPSTIAMRCRATSITGAFSTHDVDHPCLVLMDAAPQSLSLTLLPAVAKNWRGLAGS